MTMFVQPLVWAEPSSMNDTEKMVWFVVEAMFTRTFTTDYVSPLEEVR